MINYVTIKKFCAETGYTEQAVNSKIKRGDWFIDKEYIIAPDGRILININGYHSWAEKRDILALDQAAKVLLQSHSITRDTNAGNVSSLSPRPLT